jgi:tetratricopeptide (TPR) repeat protein
MRHMVWALLLILTVNCYAQGRRPVDPDHPSGGLVEPLWSPFATVPSGQPINSGRNAQPGMAGTVSVNELKVPAKAIHELEQSLKAYKSGDLRGSATHLEKVLSIDPQYYPAHNALGRLYVRLHEYEKALGEFEKATAAEPGSAQERHNLSATLCLLKRYPESESAARATLQLDPMRATTQYVLANALIGEGHVNDEVVALLKQSSAEVPNARLVLAHALIRRGAKEEAKEELRAYLATPGAPGKDDVRKWVEELESEAGSKHAALGEMSHPGR